MDPLTHVLTGTVLARAGFNRRAAYVTLAMAIAAEFPDVDTVSSLWGPITGFAEHRGIVHTFLAVPFEAALLTGAFWLFHRFRKMPKRPPRAPVHWGWLAAGVTLALLSHLLLDWTNNYGLRPFLPFNPHWYAGSFVFIVEPVMLIVLAAALVLPPLFGLINAEVGARKTAFPARGWAIAALSAIGLLYGLRLHERQVAETLVFEDAPNAERVFASPYPMNPFQWSVVSEFADRYELSTVATGPSQIAQHQPSDTLFKPQPSAAIDAAKATAFGRVYLDWSMFPVLTESPDTSDPNHPLVKVTFADARFMYDTLLLKQGRHDPPISGYVLLDMQAPRGRQEVEYSFDGLQK
jgi:inner membrane protein